MGQIELLFARTVDERRPPHAGGDREDPRFEFPNDGCRLIKSTNQHQWAVGSIIDRFGNPYH